MLTPRENLLTMLRHERPEWTPIGGHVDPYNQPNQRGMDPVLAEKLAHVCWSDESTVAFSRYLGLDITDPLNPANIAAQRTFVPMSASIGALYQLPSNVVADVPAVSIVSARAPSRFSRRASSTPCSLVSAAATMRASAASVPASPGCARRSA